MTFKDAKAKLKELASGKCYVITIDVSEYTPEVLSIYCKVYIDGYNFYSGSTWEEAFAKLEIAMNPVLITEEMIEEMIPMEELVC